MIYQTLKAGNIDLRAIPIEGGEARTVVETPHQDYHPFVSASGWLLYFHLDHKNLWRVPGPAQNWRQAEPEKATNLPESGLFLEDPQISKDGLKLLYSHEDHWRHLDHEAWKVGVCGYDQITDGLQRPAHRQLRVVN